MQSQLELFRAVMAHEDSGKVLFYANFSPNIDVKLREKYQLSEDVSLRDYFGMFNPQLFDLAERFGETPEKYQAYYDDIDITDGSRIDNRGVLRLKEQGQHFSKFVGPLRNVTSFKQIEDYPYPVIMDRSVEPMAKEVELLHSQGKVVVASAGQMFEWAWQIRGMENFLMDMLAEPEWSDYILDRMMEQNIIMAKISAEAGVDYIMSGDDVAMQQSLMFDIETWRKTIKVRWAEVYAAAKEINPDVKIWYHSDGDITDIIPELIEIGVDILNPLQPECVDLAMVQAKYGDKLVIDGTIGTQTTMPFGTVADVEKSVKQNISIFNGRGLIIAPTHIVEPEVPLENIEAFVKTCQQYNQSHT